MRIALLADVHANLEALRACLAHARAQGVERYAFLGDLVGYGADPVRCIEIATDLTARGAIAVRGNHDAAALGGLMERMAFHARDAIYWTREQLGKDERAFLASLPLSVREDDMLFVHASADRPDAWEYVTSAAQAGRAMQAAQANYCFCGHVHQSTLYYALGEAARVFDPVPGQAIPLSPRRRWLAIAGSVGQPRDGNNAASYAVYDRGGGALTYHRVPYDYLSAAAKVRAVGLGEHLARRLEEGR